MPSSYSAMKLKMGKWDYYVVRMKMSQLAREVRFASEVNDDKTLDEVIQRELKESRAKKQIVRYLQKNEERFFGSIVVAALGGEPSFAKFSKFMEVRCYCVHPRSGRLCTPA